MDSVIKKVRWAFGDCKIKNRMEKAIRIIIEEEVWKAFEVGWVKVNCDAYKGKISEGSN